MISTFLFEQEQSINMITTSRAAMSKLIFWKESFLIQIQFETREIYSLEIFRSLSEILFTQTGSEVYLASCFVACRVTSSRVGLGCQSEWIRSLIEIEISRVSISLLFQIESELENSLFKLWSTILMNR